MAEKIVNGMFWFYGIAFGYIMITCLWEVLGWQLFLYGYFSVVLYSFFCEWERDARLLEAILIRIIYHFIECPFLFIAMIGCEVYDNLLILMNHFKAQRTESVSKGP